MKARVRFLVPVLIAFVALVGWFTRAGDDEEPPSSDSRAAELGGRRAFGRDSNAAEAVFGRGFSVRGAPRASVSGTVRDEAGKPVVGAQVCALLDSGQVEPTLDVPCVTSESDGHYRIDGLFGVRYEVTGSAAGYVPAEYRGENTLQTGLQLVAGRERDGVDLRLSSGGVQIRGVVRDVAGGVIEGALVEARRGRGRRSRSARTTVAHSGSEGEFSMWVAPGQTWLEAQAEGYAPESRLGRAPGYTFELFLTPESVLAGRVVDVQDGSPVEGAKVIATGKRTARDSFTFSDAQGRFRIEGLAPGRYKPEAISERGYGVAEASVHLGVSETAEDLELRLHPAFPVRGVLLVAQGDATTPCTEGSAVIRNVASGDAFYESVGNEGVVLFPGILPGTYEVIAHCTGYVSEESYGEIEVGIDATEDLRWLVKPGLSIRGTIVGLAASDLDGLMLDAQPVGGDARGKKTFARDDTIGPDGVFELIGVSAGSYELTIRSPMVPPLVEPVAVEVRQGQSVEGVHIELSPPATVRGRVEDEHGKPVSGVTVRSEGPGTRRSQNSSDDGRFELTGLAPGRHRITARVQWAKMRKPGTTDDDVQGERVELEAGDTAEITLVVESQGASIQGVVVDESGTPIADAFVRAERQSDSAAASASRKQVKARWGGWDEQPVMTDDEGRFEISGLPQTKHTLRAWRRGGGEGFAVDVDAGARGVQVKLAPTGRIEGIVVSTGGGAPRKFEVSWVSDASGYRRNESFFETDGRFVADELPPGTYEVVVDSQLGSGRAQVVLAEGAQKSGLEIALAELVSVRGTVIDVDTGEPVPGLIISVDGKKTGSTRLRFGGSDKRNVTNEAGEFELDSIATGPATVTVLPADFKANPDYSFTRRSAKIGDEDPYVLAPIRVAKRRVSGSEPAGYLGFKIKERDAGVDWMDGELVVGFVRPGGPAAEAGLLVGQQIVAVDGHDVTGNDMLLYYPLVRVPAGTKVALGVKGGKTVSIVAAEKAP